MTKRLVVLLAILWLPLAFVLDRYAVGVVCKPLSDFLAMKMVILLPFGKINLPKIGLVVVLLLPLVVTLGYYVPWRSLREKSQWVNNMDAWSRIPIWMLLVPLAACLGQILYMPVKAILPEAIKNLAEAFGVKANVSIFKYEAMEIEGTLGAFVGLFVGSYLFLTKGLMGFFKKD